MAECLFAEGGIFVLERVAFCLGSTDAELRERGAHVVQQIVSSRVDDEKVVGFLLKYDIIDAITTNLSTLTLNIK